MYQRRICLSAFLLLVSVSLSGCASGSGSGLPGLFGQHKTIDQELLAASSQGTLERYSEELVSGASAKAETSELQPSWLGARTASSSKSCGNT